MTQIIPAAVWKNKRDCFGFFIMIQYLDDYQFQSIIPNLPLNEEHLKQLVKATLKELKNGASNAKEGEMASLQSDEFIKKVKESKKIAQ